MSGRGEFRPWVRRGRGGVAGATVRWALLAAGAGLALAAGPVRAQQVVLDGVVLDGNGDVVSAAVVELGTAAAILTDDEGQFRLEGIEPATYRLRIRAFGFDEHVETLDLRSDRTVTIVLRETAFELDTLVVGAGTVEVRGRVWDPVRDEDVPGAEIRTSQGEAVLSGAGGRFDFEAWENVPVRILVLAFGYLPVDTILEPTDGADRIDIALEEDPVITAMLGAALRRLDDRAGGRRAITIPPLERDDLTRWRGSALDEVLRLEYPVRSRRVICVVADEWPMSPLQAEGFLTTTPAWEIQRMEFLFGGRMLRVYTRDFMTRMLSGATQLGAPVFVASGGEPFCA